MSVIFDSNGKFVKQTLLGCTVRSFNAQRSSFPDNSGPVNYSATLQQEPGQIFEPDLSITRGIGSNFPISIGMIETSGSLLSWSRQIIGPQGSGSINIQMTESIRILSIVAYNRRKQFLDQQLSILNSGGNLGGSCQPTVISDPDGGPGTIRTCDPPPAVQEVSILAPGLPIEERIQFVEDELASLEISWLLSERRRDEYVPATLETLQALHSGEIITLSEGVDSVSPALSSHLSNRETLTPEEIANERFSSTKYTVTVAGPPKIAMINSGIPLFTFSNIVIDPTHGFESRDVVTEQKMLPDSLSVKFSTDGVETTYSTERLSNSSTVNQSQENSTGLNEFVKEEEEEAKRVKDRVQKACDSERRFNNDELDEFPEEDDFTICQEISDCTAMDPTNLSAFDMFKVRQCEDAQKRAETNYIAKKKAFDKRKPATGSGVIVAKTLTGPFYQVRRLSALDIDSKSFGDFILDSYWLSEWHNVRNMAEPEGSFGYLLPGQRVNVEIFQDDPRSDPIFFMEAPVPPLYGKIVASDNGRIYTLGRIGGKTPDSWESVLNVGEEPGAAKGYIPKGTRLQVDLTDSFVPFISMTPPVFAPPL